MRRSMIHPRNVRYSHGPWRHSAEEGRSGSGEGYDIGPDQIELQLRCADHQAPTKNTHTHTQHNIHRPNHHTLTLHYPENNDNNPPLFATAARAAANSASEGIFTIIRYSVSSPKVRFTSPTGVKPCSRLVLRASRRASRTDRAFPISALRTSAPPGPYARPVRAACTSRRCVRRISRSARRSRRPPPPARPPESKLTMPP